MFSDLSKKVLQRYRIRANDETIVETQAYLKGFYKSFYAKGNEKLENRRIDRLIFAFPHH